MWHVRKKVAAAMGFNPIEAGNKALRPFMHRAFIHKKFDEAAIERFLDFTAKILDTEDETDERHIRPVALVFDDILHNAGVFKKDCISVIHKMGRHYKLFMIATAQYIMDYPSDQRSQVGYIFAFGEVRHPVRKRLYEQFFEGLIPSFDRFCTIYDKITRDKETGKPNHRCMVLESDAPDGHYIKYFEADRSIPDFRIGKTIFNKLADYYYSPGNNTYDIEAYGLGRTPVLGKRHSRHHGDEEDDDAPLAMRGFDEDDGIAVGRKRKGRKKKGSDDAGSVRLLPLDKIAKVKMPIRSPRKGKGIFL